MVSHTCCSLQEWIGARILLIARFSEWLCTPQEIAGMSPIQAFELGQEAAEMADSVIEGCAPGDSGKLSKRQLTSQLESLEFCSRSKV